MPNEALPTRNKAGHSVVDRGSAPFVSPLPVPASPRAIADYRLVFHRPIDYSMIEGNNSRLAESDHNGRKYLIRKSQVQLTQKAADNAPMDPRKNKTFCQTPQVL